MKHVAIMLYTVGLAVATLSTQAVRAQTPVGTAFTYQGQLKQGGVPVNGAADIQFTLWSAPVDGDAQGTIEFVGVDVRNGLFTVSLDFGAGGFDGSARWLEIHVRYPPDAGPFLPLSPRQRISPTPYALALPGLRTQQNDTSPNVIGGWRENAVTVGVVGATISGGGATISDLLPNRVTDDYGAKGVFSWLQ